MFLKKSHKIVQIRTTQANFLMSVTDRMHVMVHILFQAGCAWVCNKVLDSAGCDAGCKFRHVTACTASDRDFIPVTRL